MWQVVPLCKAILTPELKKLTPAELVLDAGGGMQRPPCLTYSEDASAEEASRRAHAFCLPRTSATAISSSP